MRNTCIVILLLAAQWLKAQEKYNANSLPVFKQVSHPFMPTITSRYLFFSTDGLMWFSTARGLTSFDGSDLVYYSDVNESNSCGLNSIAAIAEDKEQNLYIATPKCLVYYNRNDRIFHHLQYNYSNKQQLQDIGGAAVFIDNAGLVYFGTGTKGLFIYNPFNKIMQHFNLDATKPDGWQDKWLNTVVSFATHANDTSKIWLGTYHGIYLFDKHTKKISQNFEIVNMLVQKHMNLKLIDKQFVTVEKMDVVNDSTIWFNSWAGGFGHYNINTGKVNLYLRYVYKSNNRHYGYIIPGFAKWQPGKYLLGIFSPHPAIYDVKTGKIDFIKLNPDTASVDEVRFVTNDRHGNLWILSKGQLYAELPVTTQLLSIPVKKQMHGIYFNNATKQYYATPYGVYVYDTNFNRVKTIPVPLFNNYFTFNEPAFLAITKDGSGRFWTTGLETYILNPGHDAFDHIGKIFPSLAWIKTKGEFNDAIVLKNGDILLGNINGTVYHINHQTLLTDSIKINNYTSTGNYYFKAMPLNYDSNRNVVYIQSEKTIAQYSFATKTQRPIPYQSLFGNVNINDAILDFALDYTGRIWIWIPGYGIRIIDPDKLKCVDSIQIATRGLMNGDFTRMCYGGNGFMFFQASNGIVIYNYTKNRSILLDKGNGLISPVSRFMGYCNGYLWLSGYFNIQNFNLNNFDKLSLKITPVLNSIMADTARVYVRGAVNEETKIYLNHNQNNLNLSFSAPEFYFPERIEYAYKLIPADKEWHYTGNINRKIIYSNLSPGKYFFRLKAQMIGGNWDTQALEYTIIIKPAWWQTLWFRLLCLVAALFLTIYLVRLRIQNVRNKEIQKSQHEKELLELEAQALRLQMNPHFIFNCMNSIKSLIQQHEEDKAVRYLTTFSKLIRTLFSNADKKEITLFDEMETCKLYLQLEAMRFDARFSYQIIVDEHLDLKSIQIPALIIQPFIENAIWHGIVPKNEKGHILLSVLKNNKAVEIIIDDDGIGREASKQNKSASGLKHNSKGVNLTQSRLLLDNMLKQRHATIAIIDKRNYYGLADGTKVIITINEEIS
ncbi:MAG: histidine kinase [Ferruginibacter sp.]|nr:histidine kinase [Ferruginibacter sp.]